MKKYKMKINGEKYEAKIISFDSEAAKVDVNGNIFLVEFEDNDQNHIPKISRTYKESPGAPQLAVEYADGTIKAPIPGVIASIMKKVGDRLEKGDTILTLEAMKMESDIEAPACGVLEEILVKEKSPVHEGDVLVKIKFDAIEHAPAPKQVTSQRSQSTPTPEPAQMAGSSDVVAPIPGTIMEVLVKAGDRVDADQAVIILEAMKMESEVSTTYAGTVKKVLISKGQAVQEGEVLIELGD
ncbi:hypothetical protein JEZ13_04025 [bacterium]|nr:hypothetical protein [bacterium]